MRINMIIEIARKMKKRYFSEIIQPPVVLAQYQAFKYRAVLTPTVDRPHSTSWLIPTCIVTRNSTSLNIVQAFCKLELIYMQCQKRQFTLESLYA